MSYAISYFNQRLSHHTLYPIYVLVITDFQSWPIIGHPAPPIFRIQYNNHPMTAFSFLLSIPVTTNLQNWPIICQLCNFHFLTSEKTMSHNIFTSCHDKFQNWPIILQHNTSSYFLFISKQISEMTNHRNPPASLMSNFSTTHTFLLLFFLLQIFEPVICLLSTSLNIPIPLTAHNWQKWKRVFLTCSCHEIYRDEAVSLKRCKYTWKITIYVNMWNLGQFSENLIFCQ